MQPPDCESLILIPKPNALNGHVRFDEREVETEYGIRYLATKGKPGYTDIPPPKPPRHFSTLLAALSCGPLFGRGRRLGATRSRQTHHLLPKVGRGDSPLLWPRQDFMSNSRNLSVLPAPNDNYREPEPRLFGQSCNLNGNTGPPVSFHGVYMFSLRSIFDRRSSRRSQQKLQGPRRRFQPTLEPLESRTLLNNRTIVPVGTTADNVSTFATLQAALTTNVSAISAYSTITIDAGSAPGTLSADALGSVGKSDLVIQGQPGQALSALPTFMIGDAETIPTGETNLVLKNVNVGFVGSGTLTVNTNMTITGSTLTNINSSNNPTIALAGTLDEVTNNTISNEVITAFTTMIEVATPSTGSDNLISDNTFNLNDHTAFGIRYLNSINTVIAMSDQITNNTFNSATLGTDVIQENENISGFTVQGNTFAGTANIACDIVPQVAATSFAIKNNTFDLSESYRAIDLVGPDLVGAVTGNDITEGNTGTGLFIETASGTVLALQVQANDFHNNLYGIDVYSVSGGPVGGIDLGGGTQNSVGENDFRGILGPNAIRLVGIAASNGTINAQDDIFTTPISSSVTDPNHNLNTNNALTGNTAFVIALYNDLLHRTGNITNPNDAGGWIAALNAGTLTQAAVANDLANSTEALNYVVNGLYQKVLDRPADAAGQANFISSLQHGGTIEQVVVALVCSPEYAALVGSNAGFVQGLYGLFLGRVGSAAEVQGWVNAIAALGEPAVANAILTSAEARTIAVNQLYGTPFARSETVANVLYPVLHRETAPRQPK